MASLKEIKARLSSIQSTRKITSARQMISSAYLHRTQIQFSNICAYKEEIDHLIEQFYLPGAGIEAIPDTTVQSPEVAIIIISSNTGMCGSFNTNMIKQLQPVLPAYPEESLVYYPIGSKIREAIHKLGYPMDKYGIGNLDYLSSKFTEEDVHRITNDFIHLYQDGKFKRIDIVYYAYRTVTRQEIKIQPFLPYPYSPEKESHNELYIIEPNREEFSSQLMQLSLYANFYYTLISNQTSEHAARLLAMQTATENADKLYDELQITYNKLRQQSITSELLDIMGGTFA